MTRQTSAPLVEYSLTMSGRSAREIVRLVTGGDMIVDPPYQRSSVWTADQRISLIESWIRHIPIPAVVINDRAHVSRHGRWTGPGGGVYALVDGRQRVETAMAWFTGKLAVPASWFEADDVERTENTGDGPYVRYTGLSKSLQRGMGVGDFEFPVVEARLLTLEEEARLYLLLNSAGTAQTAADLDRARKITEGTTR